MQFALISADLSHRNRFRIDGESGDCTSFMNWVNVWSGEHLAFESLRNEDNSYLADYDVIMMSGHPHYVQDLIRIAKMLKQTDTVTMFYPEGSMQLYDASIHNLHSEYYEAWNACDIVSSAEEDKLGYYRAFIQGQTIVRFIHVPTSERMSAGNFLWPREKKQRFVVVYGDNNPNHPVIATACAAKLGYPVVTVAIDKGHVEKLKFIFPEGNFHSFTKLGQYPFLNILKLSAVHFYPTEWIGTARQQVACAVTGTPCIGNHDSHTQNRLYPPDLAFDIYDIDGMTAAAKRLLEDEGWYNRVAAEAFEKVKFYNLENTKGRFMEAVEDARAVKRKASVPA